MVHLVILVVWFWRILWRKTHQHPWPKLPWPKHSESNHITRERSWNLKTVGNTTFLMCGSLWTGRLMTSLLLKGIANKVNGSYKWGFGSATVGDGRRGEVYEFYTTTKRFCRCAKIQTSYICKINLKNNLIQVEDFLRSAKARSYIYRHSTVWF